MASKRKHTELLIEEKKLLCEFKAKNPRICQDQLAEWCQTQFGKKPGRSTIGDILRCSEKFSENISSPAVSRSRDRDPMCPKLEQAVILWLNDRCQSVGISEEMLRTKAKQLAENPELEVPDNFRFSNGWLEKMKNRGNIKCFVKHGEAGTVTEADAQKGRQEVLKGTYAQ